jgi:hypothetical protein
MRMLGAKETPSKNHNSVLKRHFPRSLEEAPSLQHLENHVLILCVEARACAWQFRNQGPCWRTWSGWRTEQFVQ